MDKISENELILHLKYKYYEMIKDGKKTIEYREVKPYWKSRLHHQSKLIIIPGYNLDNHFTLYADITKISKVHFSDLPYYAKEEFKGKEKSEFFAIEFNHIRPGMLSKVLGYQDEKLFYSVKGEQYV